ncbi:MAG: D-TA family PLP-dependent enzyme [Bacteroidales bacterium]
MENLRSSDTNWYEIENAAEVSSPSLLVYPDRIESNIRQMIKIAGDVNRLRPHVKTHKMAEVVGLQLDAGITKFKCATISEAEMLARCGAKDILLALQPVGPNIGRFFRLRHEFPEAKISCIVDSEEVIIQLSGISQRTGRATNVWIDINNGMNRSGISPGEKAVQLAKKIIKMPELNLKGLHLYDGHILDKDFKLRKETCEENYRQVNSLLEHLEKEGITQLNIVAGGTSTFPVHARRKGIECSPGTPVLWDYGYSSSFPDMDFKHAAILFTRIISKPAKNLICLDLGHKAVASEMPQPRVIIPGLKNYSIMTHSEEHMVVETSEAESLKVGAVFYCLPWHICPTVDRYDSVPVVRDGRVVDTWDVVARKRVNTI